MHSEQKLRILKNISVSDIDRHLSSPALPDSTLVLPNNLSGAGGLGVGSALAQFLLTWSRRSTTRVIDTFLNAGDEQGLSDFVSRSSGLAAAFFADKLTTEEGQGPDVRFEALTAGRPRIQAMFDGNLAETTKGREIEFTFVRGAAMEFHGSFYSRAPNKIEKQDAFSHGSLVRSSGELDRFFDRCLAYLRIDFVPQELFGLEFPFGTLLAELFRNTAEHAYSNTPPHERNLRLVRIANVFIERHRLAEHTVSAAASREVAEAYFSQPAHVQSRTANFLELSILDSGPGFAETARAKNRSTAETERQLVARCFEPYQSSKGLSVSGLGLQRILRVVTELNGFVRVRTGQTEAFYAPVEGLSLGCPPLQFVHDETNRGGQLAKVEGTLVTVGIPVPH